MAPVIGFAVYTEHAGHVYFGVAPLFVCVIAGILCETCEPSAVNYQFPPRTCNVVGVSSAYARNDALAAVFIPLVCSAKFVQVRKTFFLSTVARTTPIVGAVSSTALG